MQRQIPFHWFANASAALLILFSAQLVQAHFVWLVPETAEDKTVVQVYFGESAEDNSPEYLNFTKGMKGWAVTKSAAKPLELQRTEESVSATIDSQHAEETIFAATHDLGVMDRGGLFRLKYYAKSGPVLGSPAWTKVDNAKQLRLDMIPEQTTNGISLQVLFSGKALEGGEVTAEGPGLDGFEGVTGESGTVEIPVSESGVYSIRVKHVEKEAGEFDGKKYPETRNYTTMTLRVQSKLSQAAGAVLQSLEEPVTSFGGAILDGNVYIYGGHQGGAHSYANDEQGHTLKRLSLKTGKWEDLAEGPGLQGLALVAHGSKLYRIGGFTAKNAEGEAHDLWSQNSVAAFDLNSNKWSELPALPEERSSFDAAVLGDSIYVFGGWKMAGEADSIWHKTAWSLDLSAETPEWTTLPEPPFQRRALAVAAHQGKLYAIGGMQQKGGPTTRTDIYNPATKTWSQGANLVVGKAPAKEGKAAVEGDARFPAGMTGFGVSAFATGGHLYVTTIQGDLQRLSADGSKWEIVKKTPTPRFFHRLLPVSPNELLVVGGASMETGKFDAVEIIKVSN